jgi:hypothetical protein
MKGVYFTHKGDFSKTEEYFKSLMRKDYLKILETYGQRGVDALMAATPVDSGLAASSWGYSIEQENGQTKLIWTNSDVEGGYNIVILIDRGHATKSGSWVPGLHFIDEAISPIIAELVREVVE